MYEILESVWRNSYVRDQKFMKIRKNLVCTYIIFIVDKTMGLAASRYDNASLIFSKQTLMCNTIINKFLFAASSISLVLDWIQSNQSGFPLKVAKKLSEIFLGPSLLQIDNSDQKKYSDSQFHNFFKNLSIIIKKYLTCFSSSI